MLNILESCYQLIWDFNVKFMQEKETCPKIKVMNRKFTYFFTICIINLLTLLFCAADRNKIKIYRSLDTYTQEPC